MENTDPEKKEWTIPDELSEEPSQESPPTKGSRSRQIYIATAAALLVLAALLWFFFQKKPAETPSPKAQLIQDSEVDETIVSPVSANQAEPESIAPPPLERVLCTLNESDDAVREKAAELSADKRLSSILKEADLIRRFVAITNAVALGESPARLMESQAPRTPFKVFVQDEGIFVDPVSYRRYSSLVNFLLSLNVDLCATLYVMFEGQIEEAYRELGQTDPQSFFNVLEKAVSQLRRTPTPPDRPKLLEKTLSYAYADTRLEELNAAQKHFMRLGPEQLHQLQGKFTLLLDTLKRNRGD